MGNIINLIGLTSKEDILMKSNICKVCKHAKSRRYKFWKRVCSYNGGMHWQEKDGIVDGCSAFEEKSSRFGFKKKKIKEEVKQK